MLRSKQSPDAAPERLHPLYWHTVILLKLKLYHGTGAYLQMGNQLDLDIGSHGKLLDSYTGSALGTWDR